ncbi:hypothetical protein ACFYYB_40520 [Streptomyces sp. NPDC002886]|uniref:terpene synthase family protein n=1 Tax=Streptomyces sp. NPDC002886 TaxID=3364667 RepID=UPI0036B9C7F0
MPGTRTQDADHADHADGRGGRAPTERPTVPKAREGGPAHPGADGSDFDARAAEFMSRFGLGGGPERRARMSAGLNRIAVRIAPYADPFAAQLLSDLAAWVFAFDDLCDEELPNLTSTQMLTMVARLQRTIEAPEVPLGDDPFALALRDIRLRVDTMATPVQTRRWVDAMRGYFLAEARIGPDGAPPGGPEEVSDYLLTRMHSGAALAVPVLLDAAGSALPAPLWEDRRIRALTEMAAGIVVVDSDIHSFAKESRRGSRSGNLITLPGQGVRAAYELRDAIARRFLHLGRQTARAPADPRIQRYLDVLAQYVGGARDWCGETSRYHPGPPDAGRHRPRPTGTAHGPADDAPAAPPPIASIAWWWTVGVAPPASP